jgi:hypothetical protein
MTTKTYDVIVRVPASKVTIVIQTLEGEGELISATPTPEEPRGGRRKNGADGGPVHRKNRKTGVLGRDLVLQVAAGGAETKLDKFEKEFLGKGFAIGSVKARLSEAISEGRLVEVRKNVYQIAPSSSKTAKKGAAS